MQATNQVIICPVWNGSHLYIDLLEPREVDTVFTYQRDDDPGFWDKYPAKTRPPTEGRYTITAGTRAAAFEAPGLSGMIQCVTHPQTRFQLAMLARPRIPICLHFRSDPHPEKSEPLEHVRVFQRLRNLEGYETTVAFELVERYDPQTEDAYSKPELGNYRIAGIFESLSITPFAQIDHMTRATIETGSQDIAVEHLAFGTDPQSYYRPFDQEYCFEESCHIAVLTLSSKTESGVFQAGNLNGEMVNISGEDALQNRRPAVISWHSSPPKK